MKTVIHQPPFLPKMVEFVRIINADAIVFMCRSQFVKQSSHNRVSMPTIKTGYVTLPVHNKLGTLLNNTHTVDLCRWVYKFEKQVEQSYKGLVNYDEVLYFVKLLRTFAENNIGEPHLARFNIYAYMALIEAFKLNEVLGKVPKLFTDTQLTSERPRCPSTYVGDLLVNVKASSYVSGKDSMDNYLDISKLPEIPIFYQDYKVPEFATLDGLTAYDSVLEYLTRYSKDQYLELLRDRNYDYRNPDIPIPSCRNGDGL